jgi:hypothetical protein
MLLGLDEMAEAEAVTHFFNQIIMLFAANSHYAEVG